jgi:hypothetical protein
MSLDAIVWLRESLESLEVIPVFPAFLTIQDCRADGISFGGSKSTLSKQVL